MKDSFSTRTSLEVNGKRYLVASLARLGERYDLKRLPYSMKILLENLLRHEDGVNVTAKEIEAVATQHAQRYALVPLMENEPVGVQRLLDLAGHCLAKV